MTPAARRVTSLIALGAATVFGVGCGVNTAEDGGKAKTSTTAVAVTTTSAPGVTTTAKPKPVLPRRPNGTLALDVQDRQGISAVAAGRFTGARVALAQTNEDRAYSDLCAGRVDVIETANVPSLVNYKACSDNGLKIVDAIQTASDAIVLATKNEADVGGDCITVQQARDIFRTGSPYTNWSQLGFDSYRLTASGRENGSANFQFFGFEVLGLNNASLADVRSDYRVFRTDARLRRDVTNAARIEAADRRALLHERELRLQTAAARRVAVDRAVAAADARVQRQIRRVNARNRRLKVIVDGRALARKNRRLSDAAKRAARLQALAAYNRLIDRRVNAYRRGVLGTASGPGVIGPFRFSYYELFEDQLRPLEIDFGLPETESGQPVRYGDLTPAEQRRVAPLLRRVIAQNQGTSVRGGAASTVPDDTTLVGLTDAQLPKTDKNRKIIYNRPNCVFPAQTTITSGAYPLARRTFMVTTKTALRRPEVVSYLRYYLDNSRTLAGLERLRLVPITDQQIYNGLRTIGVVSPRLPADPVAPVGSTTSTEDGVATITTGGTATTTTTSTSTTTAPGSTTTDGTAPSTGPGGDDSGIPGVSTRGG